MTFFCFFTWFDDGLEPKLLSQMVNFSCRGLSHRELFDCPSQKIKASHSLIFSEGMCDAGFAWLHFQSNVFNPCFKHCFGLEYPLLCGMKNHEIISISHKVGFTF